MAQRLADGSIQMADGRVVYANSLIIAADLLEILPLVTPPPAWPFVSGGGGGSGSGSGPGTPGARGADGAAGAPGAPGTQGPQGTNPGPQGNQGSQGRLGPQGDAGLNGTQGLRGFQGFQGSSGPQGSLGPQGNSGSQGNQGFQGSGTQGLQGLQGSSGGGGGGSALDIFYLDFFTQAGMLPANIYKEEIYTFPVQDFDVNLGPGSAPTHQLLQSRDRINGTGNTDYRFGWDTGALRDRMLFILGGLRCRGFTVGIMLSQLTTGGDISLFDEPFGSAGITFATPVGTDNSADYLESNDTRNREFSLALYMDRGTGIVRGFVKFGAEQWWPIGSVAGDPGQMRYAIIRVVPAGTERYNAVCPLIIRYE